MCDNVTMVAKERSHAFSFRWSETDARLHLVKTNPKKQGEKKVSEVNKNKKEQECKECGAGQMVLDAEKAELYCNVCGITTPSKDVIDANAGKNTYGGEGVATHSPVRNDDNINANIGTSGSIMSTRGMTAEKRKKWNRLNKVNRGNVRIKHPLRDSVRKKVQEMYGTYAMEAAEPYVKMMCKPLKPEHELERQALKDESLKRRLSMPKQAICRKKADLRGDSKEARIVMMAMAAVEVARELGESSRMDRRSGMNQYGITRKQLLSAKRALLNHFKARVTMGWEPKPPVKTPEERREDGVEQAVNHIHDMLSDVLSEEDHLKVNSEVEARLALLGEPTAEALTANTEVRMAVCAVFYATLVSLGLQAGMADRLGAVFGITGSGIRARYEAFASAEASGEADYNGAFLLIAMTCFEILATLHPEHNLIQKAGLGDVWNSEKGSSSS